MNFWTSKREVFIITKFIVLFLVFLVIFICGKRLRITVTRETKLCPPRVKRPSRSFKPKIKDALGKLVAFYDWAADIFAGKKISYSWMFFTALAAGLVALFWSIPHLMDGGGTELGYDLEFGSITLIGVSRVWDFLVVLLFGLLLGRIAMRVRDYGHRFWRGIIQGGILSVVLIAATFILPKYGPVMFVWTWSHLAGCALVVWYSMYYRMRHSHFYDKKGILSDVGIESHHIVALLIAGILTLRFGVIAGLVTVPLIFLSMRAGYLLSRPISCLVRTHKKIREAARICRSNRSWKEFWDIVRNQQQHSMWTVTYQQIISSITMQFWLRSMRFFILGIN